MNFSTAAHQAAQRPGHQITTGGRSPLLRGIPNNRDYRTTHSKRCTDWTRRFACDPLQRSCDGSGLMCPCLSNGRKLLLHALTFQFLRQGSLGLGRMFNCVNATRVLQDPCDVWSLGPGAGISCNSRKRLVHMHGTVLSRLRHALGICVSRCGMIPGGVR